MTSRRTFIGGALGAAVLAATSACGSGSASSTGGPGASTGGSPGGQGGGTTVKVGVIPIVDVAPIYLGQQQGFFAAAGLDLQLTTVTGGAAAVPGVISGDFDIAFSNVMSVMVAADKGLPVRFVSNGNSTSGKKPDFGGVVVPGDSSIASPKDLAGKTVSVNNLNNIGDTTIRAVVEADGGDPKSIKFVEIAFPDAPNAVERKQVDAAWILEPFLSATVAKGAKVVSYNYVDFDPKLDIAGYFSKTDVIEGKSDMITKFAAAMAKSLDYAANNPDAVREIVGSYTKISEADRAKMALPAFRPEFDQAAFTKLGAAGVTYGTLSKAPDVGALLPAT